jgi:hypothetical protein
MHRMTRVSSYAVAAACLFLAAAGPSSPGEWPTGRFPDRIGRVGLRVLQDQGATHLPCRSSRPYAMRRVPYDQQRAVTLGAALAREHDLERRAVSPELRVDPAGGRTGLRGEQIGDASARRTGRRRSSSRRRPAIQLAERPGVANAESIRAGSEGEIAADNGSVS